MKQRIRIFRRYFRQIPQPLPQQLVIIRRLRHKRQHIPVIRRQRRGHFPVIPPNPVQFRPPHHRKPAPIRMHQLMHNPDGLRLPRPRPRTEPVTPEKPRFPPHLPEIQTPQERRPRRRRPVQPHHRIHPFPRPNRIARPRRRQQQRRPPRKRRTRRRSRSRSRSRSQNRRRQRRNRSRRRTTIAAARPQPDQHNPRRRQHQNAKPPITQTTATPNQN